MSRDIPDSPAIDADSATLIESSHAAKLLAAADSGLLATGVHVYACQVSSDLRSVSVVLAGAQSRPVLANILATRRYLRTETEGPLFERAAAVRLDKTGRGRFRLNVQRPLQLIAH